MLTRFLILYFLSIGTQVKNLANDDWRVRDKAHNVLLTKNLTVLWYWPESNLDPEQRTRLASIRKTLFRQKLDKEIEGYFYNWKERVKSGHIRVQAKNLLSFSLIHEREDYLDDLEEPQSPYDDEDEAFGFFRGAM